MISPIVITPQMDPGTMASSINETFRQIESENRVKSIRDSSGKNRMIIGMWNTNQYGILASDASGVRRILIGQSPDDGRTGIWVSKEGQDVIELLGGV